jgi:steroid delta-isomerase-like uncharacterized protein
MAATPSPQESKALVRRYFEIEEERNFDALDEVLASDYTVHGIPGAEEELVGRDAVEAYFREMLEAFPDMASTIDEMVAEDDTVAYRGSFTATHEGEFMGIPPTGEEVTVESTGFFRIENGKIAEGRPQMDTFGMMQQLGVVESPGD